MKKIIKKPYIFIATPMYDGKVTASYMDSLFSYQCQEFFMAYRYNVGDSIITRSRNTLVSMFMNELKKENFTHLLWQDSDTAMNRDGLLKMISRNKDVVASPVPLKIQMSPDYGMVQNISGVYDQKDEMLYVANYAGTGIFLLSRNAVECLVENCIKNNDTYVFESNKNVFYNIFKTDKDENKVFLSEDFYLCKTLRDIGFEIFVDSSSFVSHSDSAGSMWQRSPMPLSENILNGKPYDPLPDNIKYSRWTTMETLSMFK